MRNPDGTLNGDLNDNTTPKITGSLSRFVTSSINENLTSYDLLPVIINKPPIIVQPITLASEPQIKTYRMVDGSGEYMYLHPDGAVKIHIGASVILGIEAVQPNILNVENGIPTLIPPSEQLRFVWRKDGQIVTDLKIDSINAELLVRNNLLFFNNIAPQFAGTYTCEVQNDIGVVESEAVVVEVYNSYNEASFYTNLVQNPYGKEGTDGWESINEDFTTKQFTNEDTTELIKPYQIGLFGYTPDTLFPRPYQIDTGVIKNLDMTNELMGGRGTYFTRTRYKYTQRDGTYLVRAYQDIDVTELTSYINASIYGVKGVRAFFSCYIGNALQQFLPVEQLVTIPERSRPTNYILSRPRISVENFLQAGPAYKQDGRVYVTVEEYDNDTKLPSELLKEDGSVESVSAKSFLLDPWSKNEYANWGQPYYTTDVFGLGQTSLGDSRDQVLFTADKLFPDPNTRFTYGQYAEFNKLVINKLNPKTTKIRITLNFETNDYKLFGEGYDAYDQTDEALEFIGWQCPAVRSSWLTSTRDRDGASAKSIFNILAADTKRDKSAYSEFVPASGDPRGFITALNLALMPVIDSDETNYATNITLALNNTPTASITSPLGGGLPYDPNELNTNKLLVYFKYRSSPAGLEPDTNYILRSIDDLEFQLQVKAPSSQNYTYFPVTKNNLLPFDVGTSIFVEDRTRLVATIPGGDVKIATSTSPSPLVMNETSSINTHNPQIINQLGLTSPPRSSNETNTLRSYLRSRYDRREFASGSSLQTGIINEPSSSGYAIGNYVGNYVAAYENAKTVLTNYGWILDPTIDPGQPSTQSVWREPNQNFDELGRWQNRLRYAVVFASLDSYDNTFGTSDPRQQRPYFQNYFLDLDFNDPQNTRVIFSKSKDMYPGTGSLVTYASHSIVDGVLRIKMPEKVLYGAPSAGGLDFRRYKDVVFTGRGGIRIPGNADSIPQGGSGGVSSNTLNELAKIVVNNNPIELVTILRNNLIPYCNINYTGSFYYKQKVDEIVKSVKDLERAILDAVQAAVLNSPATNILVTGSQGFYTGINNSVYTVNQLLAFSQALEAYAYDATKKPATEDFGDINQSVTSSFTVDLNSNVFSPGAEFRPITHILESRLPSITSTRYPDRQYGPSLAGVRGIDYTEFGDGVCSPRAGTGVSGSFKIQYAPIQDVMAGTYVTESAFVFNNSTPSDGVLSDASASVLIASASINPTSTNQFVE
jgi:hypothetical protein